jgi:hypothetical protein
MAKTKKTTRTAAQTTDGAEVSFAVSADDRELVTRIVQRASGMWGSFDKLSLTMDIEACHANGNPLRLADLLAADDFNFSHDVAGINRHIDRNTGKLMDCFVPRFTQRAVR